MVVAKMGEAIVKVQCKQCGKVHKPKPLPGSVAAKTPRKSAAAKAKPSRSVRSSGMSMPMVATELTFDPMKPSRPYTPAEAFTPGEQLMHPTFGAGVVESIPAPGKVRVVFGDAMRVLMQARAGVQLERPPLRVVVVAEEDEG